LVVVKLDIIKLEALLSNHKQVILFLEYTLEQLLTFEGEFIKKSTFFEAAN